MHLLKSDLLYNFPWFGQSISNSNEYDEWVTPDQRLFHSPPAKKSMLSPLGPNSLQIRSARWQQSCRWALVVVFVVFVAFGTCPQLGAQSDNDWHTGKRLDRFNQSPVSASWTQVPLRRVLKRFSKSQKVGIFLDRRVDPTTPVDIAANNVSPERFLWQVADSQKLGVCRVADFYFFGPPEVTASLPTLWEQMETQSRRQQKTYDVKWEETSQLTTQPVVVVKRFLEQLADEHGFEIENPQAIPHDVWAQVELPETSVAGRVGVILVGFGKWFERSKDGSSIKIIDFPSIETASFTTVSLSNPRETAKKMKAMKPEFPDLKITATKKRLTATGPPLQVARLRRELVQSQVVEAIAPEDKRFSLNTHASRGGILHTVAKQLNLELEFYADNRLLLQEEIKLQVNGATLNELLDEALKGTQLSYKITDTKLIISAN